MSKASLEQFYQEVLKDQALQERLQAVTDRQSLAAMVTQLGNEKGYSFTIEEAQAAIEERARENQPELSDAQLETVAGGGAATPNFLDSWGCG